MPITKSVVATHVCVPPSPESLMAQGYLAGTEWTCEVDGTVFMLATVGAAGPYWVTLYRPIGA